MKHNSVFSTSVSLGKGRGQHAAIKMMARIRGRCLKIWAVIGRHGSWGLSCLGSHWSEYIYSTGIRRLDYSINVQQYNWFEHSVCTTSVCLCSVKLYSCVHKSSVHLYKMCTVVQYICTEIYIYKVQCRVCVCVSCLYELCAQTHSSSVQVVYSTVYLNLNLLKKSAKRITLMQTMHKNSQLTIKQENCVKVFDAKTGKLATKPVIQM
jgi:hypothetical protein